ncbi:hypothetical protein PF005_g8018 [Phytophthora fragariae]|uniref:Uncharacterized protein n=2 Tax=Phytophthora fragariae TaxID=53985 RepID=A0A6A3YHV8_9STRA|nr:hypothetical protein PF003_g22590 [Phytophthora fragariae]KAE8941538.1 hypothetical protein PF009_g8670 [Phytophthora fragariae]KAE9015383.1 hypothetical protein PF011_g7644 [Phytophthora fragariae]KAE9123289.1 hypothetical protein PF007_g7117 [Phytophthora fragariae]KAE9148268.1 hypothetical protein PF006_g7131 [Phytophthora fragariae]
MSREERKMAQIIASIERMEQETRVSGDDVGRTQEPHDSARQGRGKKGKKGKPAGVKAKVGKRLKVTAVAMGPKAPFERKLTPKKRWIQLWSAQLDTSTDRDPSSSSEGTEKESVDMQQAVATSPVSEVKVTPAAPPAVMVVVEGKVEPKISEEPAAEPEAASAPVTPTEKAEKTIAPVPDPVESKLQVQTTEKQTTATPKQVTSPKAASTPPKAATTSPKAATTSPKAVTTPKTPSAGSASSSTELRVKTPLNNESSHLSPPLERNSPTTTASISPSSKVKDSDTPNTSTAAAKFSPAATEQEKPVVAEKKELPRKEVSAPRLERKSSSCSSVGKGEDSLRRDTSDRHHDRSRKRSLEESQLPMSEEAKRRMERRRRRKSNWDVGDPRKGGSPIPDPPVSAAAAAANQQSFAKYPPNRPSWRHSQSMMDMKPSFQTGHRSSSFYTSGTSSGGRRGFHHSSSLLQDRSRSAGRSSARYSYGTTTSSSGGGGGSSNYR